MKGLVIKFVGRTKNIIKSLLKDIDLDNFEFDLKHWESYGDDIENSEIDFNIMDDISSSLIVRKLFLEDNYISPEFMELLVGKKGTNRTIVETYRNFIESDYIISIVSYDYRNIEIVSKDSHIIEKVKDNFEAIDVSDKKIIELDNISLDAELKAWRKSNGI